ncbi:MAG TPA: TonB-dependent receptor plug domain-containing protein, partial [Gammaproteobacteria bacterium]|nr:TonB-dependent receptor plug domain-containing protein [Gammaproteobacteria bacterium]
MSKGSPVLTRAIRGLLLTGLVGALQLAPAYADDNPPGDESTPPPGNTAALGKIEVTGTRIRRADVEAARPVTVVTKEEIKATGLTSIGDVLQTLASAGAAPNAQFNNGGTGRTNADLRNLGPNRLLVLLDGRRIMPGLGGDVDMTTIPLSIVDHLEILQDGASAVYGSDAISGVINIITVKSYVGAEADAYLGAYDAHADGGGWDGKEQSYDYTIGSAGDKGAMVFNVSYLNDSPVYAGDRTISKEPVIGAGLDAGSFLTPNGTFETVPASGVCPGTATFVQGSCFMTL